MAQPFFLFISIDGMTDPLGSSQVLPYLVELSKKGFKIGIVSCEKKENFDSQSQSVQELVQAHNMEWHYCFYKTGRPILSQWQNYQQLKKIALAQARLKQKVVLHCRSYLPALIGLYAKEKLNSGFIFDMRGFWADERIEGNIWKKTNPFQLFLYNYFKKKETQLLAQADAIVSLTQKAKEIVLNWNNQINPNKVTVIPCCVDLNHFSNSSVNSSKQLEIQTQFPQLNNHFVLSYVGSLGTWYMAKEMLDFFKCLDEKTPSIFLFITKDDKEIIFDLALQAGISKDKLLIISSSRAHMPCYISFSNASLFFIKPSFSKSASSPTKMGELLSMGIPVITNTGVGDVDDIVQKTTCGLLVNQFTNEAYTKAVADLLLNINKYKENTIATAQQYFSLQDGAEKYATIYNSFCS